MNKAGCAAKNIVAINPNMKITALNQKVDLSNPASITEEVWGNIDLILNGLDGFPARVTVHELCKLF